MCLNTSNPLSFKLTISLLIKKDCTIFSTIYCEKMWQHLALVCCQIALLYRLCWQDARNLLSHSKAVVVAFQIWGQIIFCALRTIEAVLFVIWENEDFNSNNKLEFVKWKVCWIIVCVQLVAYFVLKNHRPWLQVQMKFKS